MSAVEPDTLGSHWRRRLYDVREQKADPLPRHRFGSFNFQREIFERITCATAVLDDPVIAFRQIDQALAAGSHDLSSTRHDPIHLQELKP